ITASAASKTYGTVASLTAYTTSGLVNSDAVNALTLSSTGTAATAAVGTYNSVPSGATGTGLTNYAITYTNGTLTVNQATLTITASAASKTYG
ncbi:MBG domain-containing protein, partial [Acinetobacter baumannii]